MQFVAQNIAKLITKAPILLLLTLSLYSSAQNSSRIGLYNLQNLFDTINDPGVNDAQFSDPRTNNYPLKLRELASAIALFSPDILAVCEVENYGVMEDLATHLDSLNHQHYGIVHYDSRDSRGIDVALFYDTTRYRLVSSELVRVKVVARDFLRAEFYTANYSNHFVIFVAHLPSKRGGAKAKIRRERANAILDSLTTFDPVKNVIVCGDFNDDPYERALLHNCALKLFKEGKGTYAYRDQWSMLDQILIAPELRRSLIGKQVVVIDNSLITKSGRYRGYPRRERPSDHFPTYIDLAL